MTNSYGIVEDYQPYHNIDIIAYNAFLKSNGDTVGLINKNNTLILGPWVFYKGTHIQEVKKYFWKTFKFDIDKYNKEVYEFKEISENQIKIKKYRQLIAHHRYDIEIYNKRIAYLLKQERELKKNL